MAQARALKNAKAPSSKSRRHVHKSDGSGQLNGSVGSGAKNVPSAAPSGPATLQSDQSGARPQLPTPIDATEADLLNLDHPCMDDFISATPRFDDVQRGALLVEDWGRVMRRMQRDKVDPMAPADVDKWREWCEAQAERQHNRGDIGQAAHYRALGWYPPRSEGEAEFLKRRRWQGEEADRAWYRERRFIAGQLDMTIEDVTDAIDKAMTNPRAHKEELPTWFTEALAASYAGKDSIKAPPADKATRWAMWKVMTDPSFTKDYERLRNEFVVFDTETTGLDSSAAIVNIAATVYTHDGKVKEVLSTLICPEPDENGVISTGSPEAVAIHGITPKMVKGQPTFAELAPRLHKMMAGRTLVAHNILFDYPKVQRHFDNAGHRVLPSGPMVDTLRMARYHQPIPEGETSKTWRRTLKASCERAGLGFDDEQAHGAGYDTEKCAELFLHFRKSSLSN